MLIIENIKIKVTLILAFTLMQVSVKSQSLNRFGLFPTIDHSGTISNKLDYSLYYFGGLNILNSDINGQKDPANFFVFYSEQALTYKVNSALSFTGSYVYERQHPIEANYRNENRFYLQSTYKYKLNRTTLKHRLRFDGRFIQDQITGDAPFTSRVRYLFGLSTPLRKENDKLYFSVYNEFFFNTYKSSTTIYGENWASASVGFKTEKAGNFEIGPLYMFWVTDKQNDLTNFLYLQLAWVTHLDFTKKKEKLIT